MEQVGWAYEGMCWELEWESDPDANGELVTRRGSETLRDWGLGFGVRRHGETPGSGILRVSDVCVGWSPGSFSLAV